MQKKTPGHTDEKNGREVFIFTLQKALSFLFPLRKFVLCYRIYLPAGALCTKPFPEYPSLLIPVMGSSFSFCCGGQYVSVCLQAIDRIYINVLTYQSVFVGGFLPFLGHGLWWAAGEETGDIENTSRDNDVLHQLDEDLHTLALGGLSTGAMGTEGDPVSCSNRKQQISIRSSTLKYSNSFPWRSAMV